METSFKKLVNLVNSKETITRKDIVDLGNYMTTMDVYRRKLTVCGFLKQEGRGKYSRVKIIPERFNTTVLTNMSERIYKEQRDGINTLKD